MIRSFMAPEMTVTLRETTVAALLTQRSHEDETLDSIVARLARSAAEEVESQGSGPKICEDTPSSQAIGKLKYQAEVLGARLEARTLGELFAEVIDATAEAAPDVVERLAAARARTRAYVAKSSSGVHNNGRTDLRTIQTRSGWWVSANIGTADIERGLKALSEAGGLHFGKDIRFWRR